MITRSPASDFATDITIISATGVGHVFRHSIDLAPSQSMGDCSEVQGPQSQLDGVTLHDVRWRGARLERAVFRGARLLEADLSESDLRRAMLVDVDLSHRRHPIRIAYMAACSNKFHVAQQLAVDRARRKQENKTLQAAGDDRLGGDALYDWLRNPAAMEPKDREEFAELRKSELKTARAWALKETVMNLYSYIYESPARLQPMIEVARMIKRRFVAPAQLAL